MGELVIKTHDFELAKKELKEFSQKKSGELEIKTVDTTAGILGLRNHKVTGAEFNSRMGTIQKHLIDLNNTNIKTIKQFGKVYTALEALDKDYIQAILVSIKATEATSQKIESQQTQIKRIIEEQKKTLEILKNFKLRLETFSHLKDVDNMWDLLAQATQVLNVVDTRLGEMKKLTDEHKKSITNLSQFKEKLSAYKHLSDIDAIWSKNETCINKVDMLTRKSETICGEVVLLKGEIDSLNQYVETLSKIVHLKDVDELWDASQMQAAKLDLLNAELRKELSGAKAETAQAISEVVKIYTEQLENARTESDHSMQILATKIKYAYWAIGGTLGLALVEFILLLLR